MFISSSNNVRGSTAGSLKARPKRVTKGSLLLPASPTKRNGSFFETTEPVGPTIVPVKDQPSTYTSDDITMQDNRSAILSYISQLLQLFYFLVDASTLEIFLLMWLTCLMIQVINFLKNMRYVYDNTVHITILNVQ